MKETTTTPALQIICPNCSGFFYHTEVSLLNTEYCTCPYCHKNLERTFVPKDGNYGHFIIRFVK